MTQHQRMLFKPKANQQRLKPKQRKCGQDWFKEAMEVQRIKQSKTTGHQQKYIKNTHTVHTHHNGTKKVHHRQNPRPNQRQGGRAAQDKTPLADCLLLSHATNPIKTPKNPGHTGSPFPKFRAQLLAWPDLSSCTDTLRPAESLQMLNGDG